MKPNLVAMTTPSRTDACQSFGKSECLNGGLGQFQAVYLMSLLLAHADRLGKFGA